MPSGSLMSPVLERELSTQSHCRTRHADPILRPLASPRPSLLASERSRRLHPQHSTVSRRSGLYAAGQRHAAEEPPPLARLASNRSSRTALTARHRPSQEQRCPSLSLHRFPVAGTSRHGTVTGSTRLAHRRDSIRHSSGRGDQWSLERSNSNSSSSRRSVSRRELSSLRPSSRLRGRATPRHVGTENSSSVSPFERLDSGLSLSLTSRHGVEHAGRGVATSERSSSSKTVATIQSRIRPSSTPLTERYLHRPAVEAKTLRGRQVRQQDSDVFSEEDMYSSMFSGSRSSSDAASLSASTSPTASPAPAPRASATPYYYYPSVATRGIAPPPLYAPEVSRSMRRRRRQERRQEILERRVARLRMLKNKIATVFHDFHHRHDHHHHLLLGGGQEAGPSSRTVVRGAGHHHHLGGGQEAGPSSRAVVRGAGHHLNSPWQYLTRMFHRAKGKKDKNSRSRTAVGVPEKRLGGGGGGGGNMHALFDALRRHLKSKRRAPAGIKLGRKGNWVRGKKMHWWQRLRRRRGMAGLTAGSGPRRRLRHGKAAWL
jgi:hypothetical protein